MSVGGPVWIQVAHSWSGVEVYVGLKSNLKILSYFFLFYLFYIWFLVICSLFFLFCSFVVFFLLYCGISGIREQSGRPSAPHPCRLLRLRIPPSHGEPAQVMSPRASTPSSPHQQSGAPQGDPGTKTSQWVSSTGRLHQRLLSSLVRPVDKA